MGTSSKVSSAHTYQMYDCTKYNDRKSDIEEHTTSLHFFIVSLLPRLSVEFRALAAKLRDDTISAKFDLFGFTLTIIRDFELPPGIITKRRRRRQFYTTMQLIQKEYV